MVLRLPKGHTYCLLSRLSSEVGWNHHDTIRDGQKLWQIISSQLNIGGQIMRNTSNGKTYVLINNREITKEELFMLQFAEVQCFCVLTRCLCMLKLIDSKLV